MKLVSTISLLSAFICILSSCATQEAAPVEFGTALDARISERQTASRSDTVSSKKFHFDDEQSVADKKHEKEENVLADKGSHRARYISDDSDDTEHESHDKIKESKNIKEEKKEDLDSELNDISAKSDHENLEEAKVLDTEELENSLAEEKAKPEKPIMQNTLQKDVIDENINLLRPVEGKIINKFGDMVSGAKNNGINFSGDSGDPIRASASGTVAHVGVDGKFGNIIIIKHSNSDLQTAYAHLSTVEVQKGQIITEGDVIGTLGQTGDAEVPMLHFAVRKGKTPVDPLLYLK